MLSHSDFRPNITIPSTPIGIIGFNRPFFFHLNLYSNTFSCETKSTLAGVRYKRTPADDINYLL